MELLRRSVRGVIGYNSPIYRAASEFLNFATVVANEGPGMWRKLRDLKEASGSYSKGSPAVPVKLRKLQHPIMLRPGTEDASTVVHTIVREEYGDFVPSKEPMVMIDAGAYIGDTSAYFLSRFKSLKIVALEPSRETYEAAKANLALYGDRVSLLNKGLAATTGKIRFSGNTTAASISDSGEQEIDCISILDVMATNNFDRIDILKMDIEGAETEIFRTDIDKWLPLVDNVLIELHGPECEQVVLGALRAANFDIRQHRSVYYCSRVK